MLCICFLGAIWVCAWQNLYTISITDPLRDADSNKYSFILIIIYVFFSGFEEYCWDRWAKVSHSSRRQQRNAIVQFHEPLALAESIHELFGGLCVVLLQCYYIYTYDVPFMCIGARPVLCYAMQLMTTTTCVHCTYSTK